MKPLLVGEAPGRAPGPALGVVPRGSAGDRLRRALGMTDDEYLGAFDRVNLYEAAPAAWDPVDARVRAFAHRVAGRPLVVLGRRVAEAFRLPYAPFTSPAPGVVVLPHPSGRCRAWNDPRAADLARRVIRDILNTGGK